MVSIKQFYRIDTQFDLCTRFSCEWSENDILGIQYGDKVHILQLNSSPCNLDDKLNFCHDIIQPPLYFTEEYNENSLNWKGSEDFENALTQPHLLDASNDKTIISRIVQIKWSPLNFLFNNTSILAVLSSVGVVMIYVKASLEWNLILNLTNNVREACHKSVKPFNTNMLCTTCISWMGYFKHGNFRSAHFATAQRNGIILIWKISVEQTIKTDIFSLDFSYEIHSDIEHLISMKWIPVGDKKGILVLGGINGEAQMYSLEKNIEDEMRVIEKKFIYEERDRLAVEEIDYKMIDSGSVAVVLIKSQYVMVILVNIHMLQVVEVKFEDLNSDITGSCWYASSQLALSTYSNGFYIVSINFDENSSWHLQANQVTFTHENIALTGFALSLNKAIWVYTAMPSSNHNRKIYFRYSICFAWSDEFAPMKDALLSETFTVRDNNDYLEMFRYLVIRKKLSLMMWLVKLKPLRDEHLKLYLYLMQMHIAVKESNRVDLQYDYKAEEVKNCKLKKDMFDIHKCLQNLMSKCAVERILSYCEKKMDNSITDFQLPSLQSCLALVKYMAMDLNRDWKTSFDSQSLEILKDIEDMRPSTCGWCQDELYGVTCMSGHPIQRCCLTFEEIKTADYIVCPCGLIAKSELIVEDPHCPFCDNKFRRNFLVLTPEV